MHTVTRAVNIKCQSHGYWQEFLPLSLMKSNPSLNPIVSSIYGGDNQSPALPLLHLKHRPEAEHSLEGPHKRLTGKQA